MSGTGGGMPTPLQRAKKALIGRDVVCAIGRLRDGVFSGGYPGTYQITGVTARTIIVRSYVASGGLHPYRTTSIRLEDGRSRAEGEVCTEMRPIDLEMCRRASAGKIID